VLVILVGLPAATPSELKNTTKYAFGHFENRGSLPSCSFRLENELVNVSDSLAQWLCLHLKLSSSTGEYYIQPDYQELISKYSPHSGPSVGHLPISGLTTN
jgi:hypothetical protein